MYFYYPDNQLTVGNATTPGSIVALTKSIIRGREEMTWPLQIAYLDEEEAVITLSWDMAMARDLLGHGLRLHTPSGGMVPMKSNSSYSFEARFRLFNFTIEATSDSEANISVAAVSLAVTAYVAAVALLVSLRRQRRRP